MGTKPTSRPLPSEIPHFCVLGLECRGMPRISSSPLREGGDPPTNRVTRPFQQCPVTGPRSQCSRRTTVLSRPVLTDLTVGQSLLGPDRHLRTIPQPQGSPHHQVPTLLLRRHDTRETLADLEPSGRLTVLCRNLLDFSEERNSRIAKLPFLRHFWLCLDLLIQSALHHRIGR